MKRVFLTGATGFIGNHVATALLQRGYQIRALVRPGRSLVIDDDGLTLVEGDVRDRSSITSGLEGCDAVMHVAALYSFWSPDPTAIYEVNAGGTRNVLEAAVSAGVPRIVYTSTVGTLAFPQGRLATESDLGGPADMVGDYKRSKFEAERIARRMAAGGAPIVIVAPTTPVGARDVKPTPTGQIIVDFLKRKLPAIVDTGLNFVHVQDVADGHVLAMEHGTVGERYLLGSIDGNLTLRELLYRLAAITGLKAPRWRVPHTVAMAAAHADSFVEGTLLRKEPRIPLEGARMARKHMWVDPSKAIRELGLPQRSVDEALAQAVDWFVTNGYAPAPNR